MGAMASMLQGRDSSLHRLALHIALRWASAGARRRERDRLASCRRGTELHRRGTLASCRRGYLWRSGAHIGEAATTSKRAQVLEVCFVAAPITAKRAHVIGTCLVCLLREDRPMAAACCTRCGRPAGASCAVHAACKSGCDGLIILINEKYQLGL